MGCCILRKVRMPLMRNTDICELRVDENRDFYYELEKKILRSLLNEGKIKQVQYELCIKEWYNQKYDL